MGKSERTGFQPTTTQLLTGRTVGQILKSIMNRNFLHKTDPEYLQFLSEYLQYDPTRNSYQNRPLTWQKGAGQSTRWRRYQLKFGARMTATKGRCPHIKLIGIRGKGGAVAILDTGTEFSLI